MHWNFWNKDKTLQPDGTSSKRDERRGDGLLQLTLEERPTDHETSFDICFVHGLTGHRLNTWTSGQCTWPRDFLLKDEILCRARVLMFGYDADVVNFWQEASHNDFQKHARSLLTDLSNLRRDTKTTKRDLIFVAHSMGGIVVQQALLFSEVEDREDMRDVCLRTVGIAFLGTPFRGSQSASWGDIANKILHTVRNTNRDLTRDLKPDSRKLDTLQANFYLFVRRLQASARATEAGKEIRLYSFYEEYPVKTIGKIVEYESARVEGYPYDSIPGNHMEMTRFVTDKDTGFLRVKFALRSFLEKQARPAPAELHAMSTGLLQDPSGPSKSGSSGAVHPSGGAASALPVDGTQDSRSSEAPTHAAEPIPSVPSSPRVDLTSQQVQTHGLPGVSFGGVSGGNINFGSQEIAGKSLSFGSQRSS